MRASAGSYCWGRLCTKVVQMANGTHDFEAGLHLSPAASAHDEACLLPIFHRLGAHMLLCRGQFCR
jgi:hypothetical protein